jgi:Uma2 family endonuclease
MENAAKDKHEFFDGEIVAMAGASPPHVRMTSNLIRAIGNRLEGGPCVVYTSDLRISIHSKQRKGYVYPDLSVICGPIQFDPEDRSKMAATNPRVLVEVSSPSTARHDFERKLKYYLDIPTLEEYVITAQDEPRVESFLRRPDGTWRFAYWNGLEGAINLPSLGIDIPMAEIYARIEFPMPEPTDPT